MQKPLSMIAIIAVASIGIAYGLGNSGSTIPPARTEVAYVVPVSTSDGRDGRLVEIRPQLQHAQRAAVEAGDAADEAADAARWQWVERGCMEDLIGMTATDNAADSAEEPLSSIDEETMLLSELQ